MIPELNNGIDLDVRGRDNRGAGRDYYENLIIVGALRSNQSGLAHCSVCGRGLIVHPVALAVIFLLVIGLSGLLWLQ